MSSKKGSRVPRKVHQLPFLAFSSVFPPVPKGLAVISHSAFMMQVLV